MTDKIVESHIKKETNVEYAIYPKHAVRSTSSTFKNAKKQLKKDGHYKCWICGCTEKLESHHIFEHALAEAFDFQEVKDTLRILDFYGYSEKMKDIPFASIDDIRNMLVLCDIHHRSELCGIHEISFPLFISMRCTKDGMITVPQDKEDLVRITDELGK